jgi:hypothetical protein
MMGRMKQTMTAAALALTLVGAGACASSPRGDRVYVREAPPVERVEVIGRAPAPGYVWVAGHWNWDRRQYSWIPGRWLQPAHGYRSWRAGHWAHDRNGWYWIEGRWR